MGKELIGAVGAMEAQITALKIVVGVLVAHSPGALESLGMLAPRVGDLLLASGLSDEQLLTTCQVIEQVQKDAQSFADLLRRH